jgi:hypothetical protein
MCKDGNSGMMVYGIILLALAGAWWWALRVWRGLERLRKQAAGAWEQLAAQLQARRTVVSALLTAPADSVPCPELAQQLAGVRQVLEDGSAPADVRSRCQVEGDLSAALKIMTQAAAIAAAPPMQAVLREITRQNNRIRIAAEFYNTQALVYNTRLATMSLKLPARLAGFRPLEAFSFG